MIERLYDDSAISKDPFYKKQKKKKTWSQSLGIKILTFLNKNII